MSRPTKVSSISMRLTDPASYGWRQRNSGTVCGGEMSIWLKGTNLDGQFRSLIDSVDVANTPHMIRYALKHFTQQCGFERFAYLEISGLGMKTFSSYPAEWQDIYLRNRYSRIDPVVTDAKRRRRFFSWSSADWAKRHLTDEEKAFRSTAYDFGLRSGITVPVAGSYGSVLMLTRA